MALSAGRYIVPGPMVKKAIEKVGGLTVLADKLGVPKQNVFGWWRIPGEWVLRVENATGISRHELRPDIYGPEEQVQDKEAANG
jgi:DNA-binding transcriptional regulator YdaS (Cro superfamily)